MVALTEADGLAVLLVTGVADALAVCVGSTVGVGVELTSGV